MGGLEKTLAALTSQLFHAGKQVLQGGNPRGGCYFLAKVHNISNHTGSKGLMEGLPFWVGVCGWKPQAGVDRFSKRVPMLHRDFIVDQKDVEVHLRAQNTLVGECQCCACRIDFDVPFRIMAYAEADVFTVHQQTTIAADEG